MARENPLTAPAHAIIFTRLLVSLVFLIMSLLFLLGAINTCFTLSRLRSFDDARRPSRRRRLAAWLLPICVATRVVGGRMDVQVDRRRLADPANTCLAPQTAIGKRGKVACLPVSQSSVMGESSRASERKRRCNDGILGLLADPAARSINGSEVPGPSLPADRM